MVAEITKNITHRRRSIRIPDYDYAQSGEYFVTICAYEHKRIFGEISDGQVRLNGIGKIIYEEWEKTPILHPNIELGAYVIMPNHFHAIIHINDVLESENIFNDTCSRGTMHCAPTADHREQFGKPVAGSIPTIMRLFKAAVTRQVNKVRGENPIVVWQRNYYEHVITTEKEYLAIDAYIENNPADWAGDKEYR